MDWQFFEFDQTCWMDEILVDLVSQRRSQSTRQVLGSFYDLGVLLGLLGMATAVVGLLVLSISSINSLLSRSHSLTGLSELQPATLSKRSIDDHLDTPVAQPSFSTFTPIVSLSA